MRNKNTSALAFCVLTLVVVCGLVFSTGVTWTKYEYRSRFDDYRCVPNETLFKADDIDPLTCVKMCHLNNQCLSFFYQPDNGQCIGCLVYFYAALWTNRYLGELQASIHFSHKKQNLMTNCKEILENDPTAASGLYDITVEDTVWRVYCDMTTEGGGWTVFQNRFDGSVDFYRNLLEYENGFGDLNGEFWLGLRYIQIFADKYPSELMLILTNADGVAAYEQYKEFRLLNGTNYTLSVDGRLTNISEIKAQSGFFDNANGAPFSTFDRDIDSSGGPCAALRYGAWWFNDDYCSSVHLNGEFLHCPVCIGTPGLFHEAFASYDSLKKSRMMMRPL